MTDLLGNESIPASLDLEEYFDVFIFWTAVFDIPSPHEDSLSKLVHDSSKTSASLFMSGNIDNNSGSAQERPSNGPANTALEPILPQTDVSPTPF